MAVMQREQAHWDADLWGRLGSGQYASQDRRHTAPGPLLPPSTLAAQAIDLLDSD